jgi:hypothetical protein
MCRHAEVFRELDCRRFPATCDAVLGGGWFRLVAAIRVRSPEGILLLGGERMSRERVSFVLLDGAFIPYLFENDIYALLPRSGPATRALNIISCEP